MRLSKNAAIVGFATATISFAILSPIGCSTPPPKGNPGTAGGTAGSATGAAGQPGAAGQTGAAGAATGVAGQPGAAGQNGAAGAAAGSNGAAGAAAGSSGAAGAAAGSNGAAGAAAGSSGGAETETACPTGVLGHCSTGVTYAPHTGFTLAMVEDFPANLDLDTDPIWTWSDGGPHPDGQTRFNKESITFQGGRMIITATSPAAGAPAGTSYAESDVCKTTTSLGKLPVIAGEFRTKFNNYRYGRYEVKLKTPTENVGKAGDGNFLATLFAFRTPKWDFWNEIDIELEANIKGAVAYNVVNPATTGHNNYPGGAAGNVAMGNGFSIQQDHVYAFEWTNNNIVWYVDGAKVKDCAGGTCSAQGGSAPVPTKSAKIMLNLWVFHDGSAFGNPANNTYPFHSEYDYFHFYKWDTETTYPVADPTMLPNDDLAFSQNNASETTYPQKTFGAKCPQ